MIGTPSFAGSPPWLWREGILFASSLLDTGKSSAKAALR